MKSLLIRNAQLVNEGKIFFADVFIKNGIIQKIDTNGIINADTGLRTQKLRIIRRYL
mgnify:CR=1 FL=1